MEKKDDMGTWEKWEKWNLAVEIFKMLFVKNESFSNLFNLFHETRENLVKTNR